jgi:hypothetical protein
VEVDHTVQCLRHTKEQARVELLMSWAFLLTNLDLLRKVNLITMVESPVMECQIL